MPTPPVKPTRAVDDQQLAVGAVLQAPHGVGPERTKPAERHPGIAHLVDQRAVHLRSAQGIDDHVALDARARPVAQSLRDIDRDVALPVGVGEQVDRLLGTRDGVEVGGEDLVAVDEQVDVVAVGDGRAGQRLGSAQEVRLGRRPPLRAARSRGRSRAGGAGCPPRTRPRPSRPRPPARRSGPPGASSLPCASDQRSRVAGEAVGSVGSFAGGCGPASRGSLGRDRARRARTCARSARRAAAGHPASWRSARGARSSSSATRCRCCCAATSASGRCSLSGCCTRRSCSRSGQRPTTTSPSRMRRTSAGATAAWAI